MVALPEMVSRPAATSALPFVTKRSPSVLVAVVVMAVVEA